MSWAGTFWIWIGGIVAVFLPIELYAAMATPGKTDTFSEFVWWAFGVRTRKGHKPVRFRLARRIILGLFLLALYIHLVFGTSPIGVIVMAPFVAFVLAYAFFKERKQ